MYSSRKSNTHHTTTTTFNRFKMGAVFSLPCFRRQRRRRRTFGAPSSSTTIPTRTVTISHPRPLGSVLPSGHSVHGGGPSSGGAGTGAGAGIGGGGGGGLSSSRSTTTSQGDKERRGLLSLNMSMGGFSQLVTLGMLDNGTSASETSKRLLDVVESSRASSDDTHGTNNTAGTGVASGSSGSTTLVDTMSSSSGANLLRGLSQAASCCSETPSASPDASPSVSRSPSQRNMLRSSSARVRSPDHKHTNSYSRNRTRSGRTRPRSYPSTHYGGDALKDRPSSPSARRRTLRKIRRVDNGWDYIRSADLDGFEDRLGRNGNRVSILG